MVAAATSTTCTSPESARGSQEADAVLACWSCILDRSKLTALCLTGLDSDEHEHVIIGSQGGVMNRYDVASIRPQSGRAAKGVNVMKLSDDDTVRDLTLLPAELGEDE